MDESHGKNQKTGNHYSYKLCSTYFRFSPDGTYRFYGPDGEFLALGRVETGTASTVKSFFEVN